MNTKYTPCLCFPKQMKMTCCVNTGGHYKLHGRSTGFAGNAHMVLDDINT